MRENPVNLKFRRHHKPNKSFMYLSAHKEFMPQKGFYGLKALESGKLRFIHIEAARRTLRRITKKHAEIFINLFTRFPVTKKSLGTRMGRGKGNHEY